MTTSINSEAQNTHKWTNGQSEFKSRFPVDINQECSMTDRPTDKVNYILDAYCYRESSLKKLAFFLK